MFLLRTGESLDIKIDSLIKNLKPLLSRHKMVCILPFFLLDVIYLCAHEILRLDGTQFYRSK